MSRYVVCNPEGLTFRGWCYNLISQRASKATGAWVRVGLARRCADHRVQGNHQGHTQSCMGVSKSGFASTYIHMSLSTIFLAATAPQRDRYSLRLHACMHPYVYAKRDKEGKRERERERERKRKKERKRD